MTLETLPSCQLCPGSRATGNPFLISRWRGRPPGSLASAHLHNFQMDFHHLYSICSLFRGTIQGTPRPAGSRMCVVYLFLYLLTFIICRFGECQPSETARIDRLPVRYKRCDYKYVGISDFSFGRSLIIIPQINSSEITSYP